MESFSKKMSLKLIKTKKEKKSFLKFYYQIYKNDCAFVDTDVFILKDMLYGKTQVAREMMIIPMAVFRLGVKVCQCMLFIKDGLNGALIGYFDALEHKYEEVQFLLLEAQKIAATYQKEKITIGINGHISCGVGILQDRFDQKATFDSRYCKEWYKDYFSHLPSKGLTTYIAQEGFLHKPKQLIKADRNIKYRFLDTKRFDAEMEKLSYLCNQTLCGTDYYHEMQPYHMKELLSGMKVFLKKENLIFVMDKDKEIGFLFWHPDYNELFCAGKKNNLLAVFLKYHFKKIKKCKINAIGVLKEYQNTIATSMLINTFKEFAIKYQTVETTFVWDSNIASTAISSKRMQIHKHYRVYELMVKSE